MAAHTKIDLYQMQSLPLDAKIRMTARRIDAFIDRNDAYLSISGGKDSRVLDDIERRFVRAKLPRVFIDTGLEHRSVRACGKKHADIILRPEKNFTDYYRVWLSGYIQRGCTNNSRGEKRAKKWKLLYI